jgi:hypothetical protein
MPTTRIRPHLSRSLPLMPALRMMTMATPPIISELVASD